MSKQANPTLVGAFALGAVAILVGAILLLGAGQWTRQSVDHIVYFDGSIEGLDVGAPVMFRGVKVGSVKAIELVYDRARDTYRIPVVVELYRAGRDPTYGERAMQPANLADLIDRGLRAQCRVQSFLTGKLHVALDFHPGTEPVLVEDSTGLPQIPSIPTAVEAVTRKLQNLPLDAIIGDTRRAMQGIADIVEDPAARAAVTNLNAALVRADGLMATLDRGVGALADNPDASGLATNLSAVLTETRTLMVSVRQDLFPVVDDLRALARTATSSLDAATEALVEIEDGLDPALGHEVRQLLTSLNDAARGITSLADTLERNPEALLKGKPATERY